MIPAEAEDDELEADENDGEDTCDCGGELALKE